MGYLKRDTIRLELPSDPAFWVDVKAKLSYGDENYRLGRVMDVSTSMDGVTEGDDPQMRTKIELSAMNAATLERAIVAWNLTDEEDNPLIVSALTIEELHGEDADFLLAEINERNPRRTKKQKNA